MRLRLRPGPCLLRLRALVTTCHSDTSYAPAPSHSHAHAISHSPRLVAWRKSEAENQEKIPCERCIYVDQSFKIFKTAFLSGPRLSRIKGCQGEPCHCLQAGGLEKASIVTLVIRIFIRTEMMKWNFSSKNMFFPCRTPPVNMILVKGASFIFFSLLYTHIHPNSRTSLL